MAIVTKDKNAIREIIRDIPDFPKKGIIFKDITPLLANAEKFKELIDLFVDRYKDKNIDYIAGIDARGFLFGSVLAYKLNAGLIPIRKKGKLPYKTISCSYELEYGTDELEVHEDAIVKGDRVLIVDDLLATGGTSSATAVMLKGIGADIVELAFVIELEFLKGREKLKEFDIFSVIKY